MIHKFEITFRVTCADGTVLEVPVSVCPGIANIEDARVFHSCQQAIDQDKEPVRVYDEFLLRLLLGSIRRMWADENRTWPDGDPPVDVLDRMVLMLCDQLRRRAEPPPQ